MSPVAASTGTTLELTGRDDRATTARPTARATMSGSTTLIARGHVAARAQRFAGAAGDGVEAE